MASSSIIIVLFVCCLYLIFVSTATNITTTKFLRDSETLLADNSAFEIGFFSPVNSTNRYVGIWHNVGEFDANSVVWVANRNNPINDSSGVLKISEDGNLQLSDRQNITFWSSNVSHHENSTSVARLLDTGNLVLLSSASGIIIWQSFEHLTDSLLPQTNITVGPSIGINRDGNPILQAWKSVSDPSNGRFSTYLVPHKNTEFITLKDNKFFWRSGPWNGSHFLGVPNTNSEAFRVRFNDQKGTLNVFVSVANASLPIYYYKLIYDGNIFQKYWNIDSRKWEINGGAIRTDCDLYGKCGPFGRCNPNDSPICNCLYGFKPKNTDEWSKGNWTSGCVRTTPLQCGITGGIADGFSRLKHMKVPYNPSFEAPQNQKNCSRKCLESCSCLAYAYQEGFGCMVWKYGNLIDIQVYSGDGVDLYIRLAHSELDPSNAPRKNEGDNSKVNIIVITTVIGATTFAVFVYCLWKWMYRRYGKKSTNAETQVADSELDQAEFKDLPWFTFKELELATNNFSEINKIGRGGFGLVYKGKLENGQDIAVKRLSRASGQGLQEFMNEVLLISKLQHNNLVKLLGCCVEQEEKLLVYEYMPNNSLDALLFDTHHGKQLDWKKRYNIISGICRGLLYLHRDSRLKIIHRDLKASNILLDEDFNPKISDFGMARIFENKQDQANTLRVVGTYGYMSPEYAMEGRFSEKSDLFSLGVLLLEIVSGRKNSSFLNNDSLSLLTYAWKLWTENDLISLIDPTILDPLYKDEILKCIQLGLLCVQEFPEDRPTSSVLISMLDFYDIMDLPHPTQPGFTHRKVNSTDDILQSSQEQGSVNYVSHTEFSGR